MSLQMFSFIFFLAAVAGIYYVIPRKYQYIWLCTASIFFYITNDVRYFVGLFFCTAVTYGTGLLLVQGSARRRKALLILCIGVHVFLLLGMRYPRQQSILTPIGISFYALQAMGYVIEVYRGNVQPEKNPVRYAVYVAFFPTVLSGPIQRAPRLLAQIREGKGFDYDTVRSGLYLLLGGHLLKRMIANPLGGMVDYAYGNYANLPGATLLWATVLYAVQLYCDFAGYSALAMGAAKVLGFDIDRNFEQPYFAASVKDFWNRWHISLSSWFRDYVYIPLGGNRKGKPRKYINLMVTFLVSGLWHGTGVHYLFWGGLHGIYQVLGSCIPRKNRQGGGLRRLLGGVVTFALVDFAWLFFRADSMTQAFSMLHRIIFCFEFKEMTYYGSYLMGRTKMELLMLLLGVALVFLVDFLHERKISLEHIAVCKMPLAVRWGCYVVLTLAVLLAAVRGYGQGASNFIYTRF